KTDGVHQLQPLFLLLVAAGRFGVFTRTARAAVTTEAAAITIATEAAAFAITAEAAFAEATAATIVTLAVTVSLAHHRRRAFLVLLDADREIADDVFGDALLALDLGDRRRRRVDVEQHEVCLAVLVHAIGEGPHAPVLGLGDLAAGLLDNAGHLGRQFFHLLWARVLTREKNMLVKRHGCPFLVLARLLASSPSRPWERTRKLKKAETRDDGPTGPVTSTKELLRPSVQLPAGIHGCAPYKDFGRIGKANRLRFGGPSGRDEMKGHRARNTN